MNEVSKFQGGPCPPHAPPVAPPLVLLYSLLGAKNKNFVITLVDFSLESCGFFYVEVCQTFVFNTSNFVHLSMWKIMKPKRCWFKKTYLINIKIKTKHVHWTKLKRKRHTLHHNQKSFCSFNSKQSSTRNFFFGLDK